MQAGLIRALAHDGEQVGMDLRPGPVEVDADDAHAVAEKGHPDRSPVIDRGVEEDALHTLPAGVPGLVLEVGVELVEVGGVEAVAIVPGDEGVLVELAVEDDLPVRPLDGDVGEHPRQHLPGLLVPLAVPVDGHGADIGTGAVPAGEVPHEVLEEPVHDHLVAQDVAEPARPFRFIGQ